MSWTIYPMVFAANKSPRLLRPVLWFGVNLSWSGVLQAMVMELDSEFIIVEFQLAYDDDDLEIGASECSGLLAYRLPLRWR